MKTPAKRAVETKRVYAFEAHYLRSAFLLKPRSITYLRRFAERVWQEERINSLVPQIIIGQGIKRGGLDSPCFLSFCQYLKGQNKIVLAKHERNIGTLLHELVHAIEYKYVTHNIRFVKMLIRFLVRYGHCDCGELILAVGVFGIRNNTLSLEP